MNKQVAMPEFIQREDIAPRAWSVQEGAPQRGDAWTEMRTATMRVPHGADDLSRVVRAHELTHAKVSPLDLTAMLTTGIPKESLVCAEEFRVNQILSHAGFNLDHLRDGSEAYSGEICAKNSDWNGMVRFIASTAGGKACKDFIRGLNKVNPEWAKQARALEKQLKKKHKEILKRESNYWDKSLETGWTEIASTYTSDEYELPLPYGFTTHTVPIAKYIESLLIHDDSEDETGSGDKETPDISRLTKNIDGRWGKLVELTLPKPKHVDGRLGRKRQATNVGKNPRRINRMLTDPEKRIFDKRARGKGGVILIDQSGSMSLSEEDIWSIISHAPGCVIIGYSHRRGSSGHPNIWVLAERGKVIDDFSAVPRNGGNGVDGPALRFALNKRRNNEPIIWVCDGDVTDGDNDHTYLNLTRECVEIVHKHNVHTVYNVDEAVSALKDVAMNKRLGAKYTGTLKGVARSKGYLPK